MQKLNSVKITLNNNLDIISSNLPFRIYIVSWAQKNTITGQTIHYQSPPGISPYDGINNTVLPEFMQGRKVLVQIQNLIWAQSVFHNFLVLQW